MQAGDGASPPCKPRPAVGASAPPCSGADAMGRWTVRQEGILREFGHLGVKAVRDLIARECGVTHTERAIIAHASRIRVSLRVRKVCPECGAVGVALNLRTGLCPKCTAFLHVQQEAAYSELLMRERMEAAEGDALDEARREYDALRQRNSRLRRKYGLSSRRGGSGGPGGPGGGERGGSGGADGGAASDL